jgi:hypothetical protein
MRISTFLLYAIAAAFLLIINIPARSQSGEPLSNPPLPFEEFWDAGSFTTNSWTFTPNQGNWTVDTASGNPKPVADFAGLPAHSNYTYSLESPSLDATPWTCASLWLDFDFKLVNQNANSTEKMTIEIYYNESWNQIAEYANSVNIDWTSKHFDITVARGQFMRVRFRANGSNSADVLHWYIDNIRVYGICSSPVLSQSYAQHQDTVILHWDSPNCNQGGVMTDFIIDDGSNENGWGVNPGYQSWLGNEFPVPTGTIGDLKSFNLYFMSSEQHGPGELTIDVFNSGRQLIGSSAPFTPPDDEWIVVAVNDIPLEGKFYAMVKWNYLPNYTNLLGYDENGQYSSQDLEWVYDGYSWDKLSQVALTSKGVFMLRASAFIFGEMRMVDLIPGNPETNSILDPGAFRSGKPVRSARENVDAGKMNNPVRSNSAAGYNVYRTDRSGLPPYSLLNTELLQDTAYSDIIGPDISNYGNYRYFVTAVFYNAENSFLCESPGSDTVQITFPSNGVPEFKGSSILIYPNPVKGVITIDINLPAAGNLNVGIIELTGQKMISTNKGWLTAGNHHITIEGSGLSRGIYFCTINFGGQIVTKKIIIN